MEITFKVQGAPHTVQEPLHRQVLGLAAAGKTMAEISLELRRSEFETASLFYELYNRGLLAVDQVRNDTRSADPVGAIQALLDPRLPPPARSTVSTPRSRPTRRCSPSTASTRTPRRASSRPWRPAQRERALGPSPSTRCPHLTVDMAALTRENFDSQEGFVLSRVNGDWDVQSILKLCPMTEEDALLIFARLLERRVIELR